MTTAALCHFPEEMVRPEAGLPLGGCLGVAPQALSAG